MPSNDSPPLGACAATRDQNAAPQPRAAGSLIAAGCISRPFRSVTGRGRQSGSPAGLPEPKICVDRLQRLRGRRGLAEKSTRSAAHSRFHVGQPACAAHRSSDAGSAMRADMRDRLAGGGEAKPPVVARLHSSCCTTTRPTLTGKQVRQLRSIARRRTSRFLGGGLGIRGWVSMVAWRHEVGRQAHALIRSLQMAVRARRRARVPRDLVLQLVEVR